MVCLSKLCMSQFPYFHIECRLSLLLHHCSCCCYCYELWPDTPLADMQRIHISVYWMVLSASCSSFLLFYICTVKDDKHMTCYVKWSWYFWLHISCVVPRIKFNYKQWMLLYILWAYMFVVISLTCSHHKTFKTLP